MSALTKFQIRKKPVCFGLPAIPDDMEVLPYPDMVVDTIGFQVAQLLAVHNLPVCHKARNGAFSGNPFETIDQVLCVLGY